VAELSKSACCSFFFGSTFGEVALKSAYSHKAANVLAMRLIRLSFFAPL
jgi:hypothetical protein